MISNFEIAVADLVMEKRRFLNITQEQLDRRMGFEGAFIGKVESHKSGLNLDHINKLAQVFNCSPKDLIPNNYIE